MVLVLQDLGLSLSRISVYELQIMAAFAVPRMKPTAHATNILSLARYAKQQASKSQVAIPLLLEEFGVLCNGAHCVVLHRVQVRYLRCWQLVKRARRRAHLLRKWRRYGRCFVTSRSPHCLRIVVVVLQYTGNGVISADANPTRHCKIYSRHPALLVDAASTVAVTTGPNGAPVVSGPAPEFIVNQYTPRDRVMDLALSSLRAASKTRHDLHRSGYTSMAEFVDWFVDDAIVAINAEFPSSEVCVCVVIPC
jgi:hypothetical protein